MNGLLGTILPWLGTALGGPLGGMAAAFIADKLGVSDKTKQGIENFLAGAKPEDLLAAKKADADLQLKMAELGFHQIYDLEALVVQDRQSARDREVKTGDNTTRILAGLYTCGYFIILLTAIFYEFPRNNQDVLNALFGMLSAAQLAIIQYYFGSSKGSADKTSALESALKKSMNGV